VRRTSHRVVPLLLAALLGPGLVERAKANPAEPMLTVTGWTSTDIHALRTSLGAKEENNRRHAWRALSRLGDDANDAISTRLEALRAAAEGGAIGPLVADVRKRMRGQARTEQNTERAVLAVLQHSRDEAALAGVEWLALVSSLEKQRSSAAATIIVQRGLAVEKQLSSGEAPGLLERLGPVAIPALIRCRNHPKAWLRPVCAEALHASDSELPGQALQQNDANLIKDILRAYGDALVFEAMPAVVSHLVDQRSTVRNAATAAAERFGKNAIWQLRERYVDLTGKDPSPHWSHERLLTEIQTEYAGERIWNFENALRAAEAALEAHAPAEALATLESILETPPPDEALETVVPWVVRTGMLAERLKLYPLALAAFRRAIRTSPSNIESSIWRARVVYLEAESLAAAGQLQSPRYETAARLDAKYAAAAAAILEVGSGSEEQQQIWRRIAAALAGSVLTAAGALFLRGSASLRTTIRDEPAPEQSEHAPA
jgi:tetratricopeptide (TPR) repeat protein